MSHVSHSVSKSNQVGTRSERLFLKFVICALLISCFLHIGLTRTGCAVLHLLCQMQLSSTRPTIESCNISGTTLCAIWYHITPDLICIAALYTTHILSDPSCLHHSRTCLHYFAVFRQVDVFEEAVLRNHLLLQLEGERHACHTRCYHTSVRWLLLPALRAKRVGWGGLTYELQAFTWSFQWQQSQCAKCGAHM